MRIEVYKEEEDRRVVRLSLVQYGRNVCVTARDERGEVTDLCDFTPRGISRVYGVKQSLGFPVDHKGRIEIVDTVSV